MHIYDFTMIHYLQNVLFHYIQSYVILKSYNIKDILFKHTFKIFFFSIHYQFNHNLFNQIEYCIELSTHLITKLTIQVQ